MKNLKNRIFSTAIQKTLYFLASNANREFTEKEISASTGVKKSAVNLALRELLNEKIAKRKKIGRSSLYAAKADSIVVKELKILQNILRIFPLIEKIQAQSQRIVLFGSSAVGTDTKESDIDLFVQSNDPDKIRKVVNQSPLREKIQLIVKTPKEMILINKKRPLLFQEIERGKVIWENYEK